MQGLSRLLACASLDHNGAGCGRAAILTLLTKAYSSAALALVSPVRFALMSFAISATVSCTAAHIVQRKVKVC